MFKLLNALDSSVLGEISETQVAFLRSQLEEENSTDRDYYINRLTVDLLEANGAESALVALLRKALGEQEDMDIRWE